MKPSTFPEVLFDGTAYLLIASHGEPNGPIATVHQYENGECSFAHLFADGAIRRHGHVVGTRDDLTFTGRRVEVIPTAAAIDRLWNRVRGTPL